MRSIAGAFDASELDESKTAHRVCIEWVIENASTPQMLKLDAEGFDAWVLEPSRNWLSTDFNIDVFHDMWVELYPELSHHFDAEKHLTAEHLAALAAAAETAATAAEDDLSAVALRRTKKLKKNEAKKAKRVKARAEARERATAAVGANASDEEAELRVNDNPHEITPVKAPGDSLKRSSDELEAGTYPGELAISLAKQEARRAADEAAAEMDPNARRQLILVSLQLETALKQLTKGNDSGFSGGNGNGYTSLANLPAALKASLDYDYTTPVSDFFLKLDDVLASVKPNSHVLYLLSCCKGRLLKGFREQLKEAGGAHKAKFSECVDWIKAELHDPEETRRLQLKFRDTLQGNDTVDVFLRSLNEQRDILEELDVKPSYQDYKLQIMHGARQEIIVQCHLNPKFLEMSISDKVKLMAACEKSIASSKQSRNKNGQLSSIKSTKSNKRAAVDAELDDDESDSDNVNWSQLSSAEARVEINRAAQKMLTKRERKAKATLNSLSGDQKKDWKKGKGFLKGTDKPGDRLKKCQQVKPIPTFATLKSHIAKCYNDDEWLAKRIAHDKLVTAGSSTAADAPHLYRRDKWDGCFACMKCRSTGHTQDRCPKN